MLGKILQHWRRALRETAEAAGAAGIAWWIGTLLFGADHKPVFAAIAAVVCLAPGLPSHSVQALGMLIGVMAGIGFGQLAAHYVPGGDPFLLSASVFAAMMLATTVAVRPIIGIQAGASAVIVIADDTTGSFVRFGSAAIGGGIALLFSQVLFTPDPLRVIRNAGRGLLKEAQEVRDLLEERHGGARGSAEEREEMDAAIRELREAESALSESLSYVGRVATRTVRGRLRRRQIEGLIEEWRRLARHLHLSLGSTAYALLDGRDDDENARRGLEDSRRLLDEAQALVRGEKE